MAYKKIKPKNEFRFNFRTKHPSYVFGETKKKYKAVGLTHSKKTFGRKNMPLDINPKIGDKRKAYVRYDFISDSKKTFAKYPSKRFKFSPTDFPKVKSKIRKYKTRYKRK